MGIQVKNLGEKYNTLKSLNDLLGFYVNVKHFGAVGDGVADDTLPIQAAIDYAKNSQFGRTVYLPCGSYRVTETILLNSENKYIKLKGEGAYVTTLFVDSQISKHTLYVGTSTYEGDTISIEGIKFGPSIGGSAGNPDDIGIVISKRSGVIIRNCFFNNLFTGVFITGGSFSNIIQECIFNSITAESIITNSDAQNANHLIIRKNGFYSCGLVYGRAAIQINGGYNVVIADNDIENCNKALQINSTTALQMSGNYTEMLDLTTMYIQANCKNFNIFSNYFGQSPAILFGEIDGLTLSNNTFYNCNVGFYDTCRNVILNVNNTLGTSVISDPPLISNVTFKNNNKNYSSSMPASGTWTLADIVFNSNPMAGGFIGWICVESGTPGVWKEFGSIEL